MANSDNVTLTINILRPASRASDSCLMLDYVHVINFIIIIVNVNKS